MQWVDSVVCCRIKENKSKQTEVMFICLTNQPPRLQTDISGVSSSGVWLVARSMSLGAEQGVWRLFLFHHQSLLFLFLYENLEVQINSVTCRMH